MGMLSDFVNHTTDPDRGRIRCSPLRLPRTDSQQLPTFAQSGELFPTGSALGQQVTVGGTPLTIVGILSQQGSTIFNDPNSVIIAPISRIQASFTGYGAVSSLTVEAVSADAVAAAQGEVEIMLNQLLGTTVANEPYTIINQGSLLQTAATSAGN